MQARKLGERLGEAGVQMVDSNRDP
jgi:hypothetical protein